MDREGTIVCLLCRGMISFKAGDKARFESHLQHEHEAYFGLEVLLAVSFIREEERKALVRAIAVGYDKSSQPQPRIDIKVALTTHKRERTDSFTDLEDRDNATASDFSFEDNEKIYGVPETILNCPQCPRTFINIFSLRRHEDLHRERNYSCESCGQRFSFLEDLKVHRDVHNSRVDDEEFKKNNLSDEMYVAKDNSDTPADSTQNNESQAPEQKNKTSNSYVRCKICLKVMKRESYAEHRAHHKDAKNHQCSFCNSRFRKQEHLLKHIQRCQRNNLSATSLQFSYREQTNYSCSICSKCFQNEDNLRCHMILHFPEGLKQNPPFKPVSYQCKFCSGNFREFSDLTAHMEEVHEAQSDNQESYYIPMK